MATIRSKALKVPLRHAEEARRYLQLQDALRHDLAITKDDTFIYFPLKQPMEGCPFGTSVDHDFANRQERVKSYQDIVAVPVALQPLLPSSFDVVGTIALIKIPEELEAYTKGIGEAMLRANPHLSTICQIDPVAGELRTRGCRVIAGERSTETLYQEHGVRLWIDVASVYFSPRLSTERRRVAGLVKDGECVVDLFAGAAPFSIMIAKFAHPRIVYALDKNPAAVVYARRNVLSNQVNDIVEVIEGDAKDAGSLIPEKADRVIMNLPFLAYEFFPTALSIAADTCTFHYYDILSEDAFEQRWQQLSKIAVTAGFAVTRGTFRKIKSYSAREFYIGLDVTATKTRTPL